MPTVKIHSTKDADVRQSQPDENFGSITAIYIRTMEGVNYRGLLEFPLNLIPDTAIIKSAILHLMSGDTVGTFPKDQTFSRIIGAWDELSVTWNNQPPVTTQNALVFSIPYNSGGGWMSFDVTPLVKDALLAGKVFGLRIAFTKEDEPIGQHGSMFYIPREGAFDWQPYIEVTYDVATDKGILEVHAYI